MIVYKTRKGNGGLGDRLVGLISCIFLSELIEEELLIDWSNPDIDFCFNFSEIRSPALQSMRLMNSDDSVRFIDDIPDLKLFFFNKIVESNLNFIDRLFINRKIDRRLYENQVLKTYRRLFNNYLIPKPNILKKINENIEQFEGFTIGVQLRMGDIYMNVGDHKNLREENVLSIFKKIKNHQAFDSIFITSDNQDVITKAQNYFKNKNVIYDDTRITHIDRMPTNNNEMLKALSDLITLSKTDFRYISLGSNFGRVSNLISESPASYKAISGSELIDKNLGELSKKEVLFS